MERFSRSHPFAAPSAQPSDMPGSQSQQNIYSNSVLVSGSLKVNFSFATSTASTQRTTHTTTHFRWLPEFFGPNNPHKTTGGRDK